jgi:hypothetical protein
MTKKEKEVFRSLSAYADSVNAQVGGLVQEVAAIRAVIKSDPELKKSYDELLRVPIGLGALAENLKTLKTAIDYLLKK